MEDLKTKRDWILQDLQNELDALNDERYPHYSGSIAHPHAGMTECNFGGKLIILSDDNESAVVWSDWAGEAIDHHLTVVEIESFFDYEENDFFSGFKLGDIIYNLSDFEKIPQP